MFIIIENKLRLNYKKLKLIRIKVNIFLKKYANLIYLKKIYPLNFESIKLNVTSKLSLSNKNSRFI